MRYDTPQVGYAPYRQVHAHSTGNRNSTAQNEADFMQRKDLNSGFYTHVVGNGRIIQTARLIKERTMLAAIGMRKPTPQLNLLSRTRLKMNLCAITRFMSGFYVT